MRLTFKCLNCYEDNSSRYSQNRFGIFAEKLQQQNFLAFNHMSCKEIDRLVFFFRDHRKLEVLLLQEYIGHCHFPHFEADFKNTTIAFFLILKLNFDQLYHFIYLACKQILNPTLGFQCDHLKILKCTNLYSTFRL